MLCLSRQACFRWLQRLVPAGLGEDGCGRRARQTPPSAAHPRRQDNEALKTSRKTQTLSSTTSRASLLRPPRAHRTRTTNQKRACVCYIATPPGRFHRVLRRGRYVTFGSCRLLFILEFSRRKNERLHPRSRK